MHLDVDQPAVGPSLTAGRAGANSRLGVHGCCTANERPSLTAGRAGVNTVRQCVW